MPALQTGLVFRVSESLSLTQVAQASFFLSQQETIKLLERSSKGNKEYTDTGSSGDALLVSIYRKMFQSAASTGVISRNVFPDILIAPLLLHRFFWQQL